MICILYICTHTHFQKKWGTVSSNKKQADIKKEFWFLMNGSLSDLIF